MPIYAQKTVIEKIRAYLLSCGRSKDFIDQFVEGYCSGISSLWLYSKWLETQPNPDDKPRDDYTWFKNTVDLIAAWEPTENDVKKLKDLAGKKTYEETIEQLGELKKTNPKEAERLMKMMDMEKLRSLSEKSKDEIMEQLSEMEKTDPKKTEKLRRLVDDNVKFEKLFFQDFIASRKEPANREDAISLEKFLSKSHDAFMDKLDEMEKNDFNEAKKLRKLMDDNEQFERFINHIQFFQNIEDYFPIKQDSLDKSLEDTVMGATRDQKSKRQEIIKGLKKELEKLGLEKQKEKDELTAKISILNQEIKEIEEKGRKLTKEYSIASLFTLEQLKQLLKTENIIQDGKLIIITSHNHATALFKTGGNYYYFNPNSDTGEIITASTDEVAKFIFKANFGGEENHRKPSPLGFRMFSFDEKLAIYPSQEKVLNDIDSIEKFALKPEVGYADGYSILIMASKLGSLEPVQYFLAKGVDPNFADKYGDTALIFAAANGFFDIVQELLKNPKINPNLADKNWNTALISATLVDNLDIVKALLANPKIDPNLANKYGNTALIFATLADNLDIVKALLKNPKIDPNLANIDNCTALRYAIDKGHIGIVKALLDAGAKSEITEIDPAFEKEESDNNKRFIM